MLPPAEKMLAVESVDEAKKLLSEDRVIALQMIDRAGEDDLANKAIAAAWARPIARPGPRSPSDDPASGSAQKPTVTT